MFVKVISGFTCWTGSEMVVGNAGDTIELPDNHATNYIEAGLAEEAAAPKGKKAKAAADEAPAANEAPAADEAPAA